jgi:hypothetical protein
MRPKFAHPLLFLGITALCGAALPVPAFAQVSVSVGIAVPTPFVFVTPPQLVLLPGSSVYVVPDLGQDLFYVDGWWWRPWEGRWYRSQYRDRDWSYYENTPAFYGSVPHDWRNRYQSRQWGDRAWNYERVPEERVTGHHGSRSSSDERGPREAPAVRQSQPKSAPQGQGQGHSGQGNGQKKGSHKGASGK